MFESEFRLLKMLESYVKYNPDKLADRVLYEVKHYEKLYVLNRLSDNADKGILDKQNLTDINNLHDHELISDNAYNYFMKLKDIAEQGFKQIEVATDNGFKYPTIQEVFTKHINTCWD